MENRIAFDITTAQKDAILRAISDLNDLLKPLLIALDKREKQMLAKMSDRTIPFVEKVMQYMKSDAQFVPSYIDVTEAENDFTAFSDLREFLRPLAQITDNLDDTAVLSGSEAWLPALTYYNAVKQAAKMGVPDAKAIYDDLRPRFEAQRPKPIKPTEPKA